MKVSIQEEDITIINIYAPNNNYQKIESKNLTELNREIDSSTVIADDFNNPLSIMDRMIRQKISEEIEDLTQ